MGGTFFKDLYITENNIALTGTTINYQHGLHVQTMCFALKYGFLEYLLNTKHIFKDNILTKEEAIKCEINLSKICLGYNYSIQTKLKYYLNQLNNIQLGIDNKTVIQKKIKDNINSSPKQILDIIKNPKELIFIKNKFYKDNTNYIDEEFSNALINFKYT